MSLLSYLRARSLRDGLWRGRRGWTVIGVVVWSLRFLRRVLRPNPKVVAVERLEPGQGLSVEVREGGRS